MVEVRIEETPTLVFRPKRSLFVFLIAASLALLALQSARMQSPLRRITNTTEEGISLNPAISGDGRFVAFESTEDVAHAGGAESFRAIRANVGIDPATFLQMGATRAPAPAVSQDGSRIAFASKDDPLGTNGDGNSEIFLYDGAKLIQVTNTSPGDIAHRIVNGNFQPSISDDGRFIAFSSNRDLTSQNADGNLEIFIFDSLALSFAQLTNSSGIVGFSDAKISGNGSAVAYIRDPNVTSNGSRDLLLQIRAPLTAARVVAANVPALALTYVRAISDDGLRVVWSAQTAANTTQVFLFDGRGGNTTRQITTLSSRVTEVPLHPTISGDGQRIAFAARRTVSGAGTNSDGSVELYTYDIPSSTFGRVTNATSSSATADVVSSLSDDGSVIAFNFPRVLSGALTNNDFANNSEIYITGTPARPPFGTLTVLNGASFGHEPSSTKAVAPDSIAVALGNNLANTTQQTQRQADGSFPTNVSGTTVTVNGRAAQIFFVSPTQVNFHVPAATEIGTAEVIVTNPDSFPSKATVTTLRAAPGIFTFSGDGLGEGVVLNADTLERGPFDPSGGNLRLIIFSTGVRNATTVSVTAGGRALTVESLARTPNMPGMDEVHVLVPADLRGAGKVELVIRADGRDSNPVIVEFAGTANRDVLINEFLADPPGAVATDTSGDANHDGVRDSSDDEFIEFVNTTTRDIDVSGYRILTRGTGADVLRHVFAAGTILRSCNAIVVFGDANSNFDPNNPAFGGALVVKSSTHSLSLLNSGGVITLEDSAAAIVSLVTYGGSSGLNADNNQSLTRFPDISGNFAQHLTASGGARAFSPGTQVNGAAFSSCTAAVARVEVSPASATINVGQQQQFTAKAYDSANNEITGVIFSWNSSNTAVATVNQNGLATAVSPGATEIRATGRGVTSAPAILTVAQSPPVLTSVTISPANAIIGVGETQVFTAQAKDQFGNDIGGVTISFASNNTPVITVDSVSATSSTGSATATITGRASGSAQITATATNGGTTVSSSPATVLVEPGAGQVLISEFRTRGPSGAADEFVEIYNPTASTVVIANLEIRASNNAGTVSDRVTIPPGTTLGSGCHYLVANSSSGGYSGSVPANQTYGTGITDDGGIAIIRSNGTTIIDAVGMSNGSAFKEGTPLAPLSANVEQSYERKPGGSFGNGTDTNNNAADFILNAASSNPQNASSGCLDLTSADLSITKSDSPDPVITGANVTYTITVMNNGAANAQSVVVTDNLPGSVSFVSCAADNGGVCGGSGNNRTITFSSLPSGSSATITLVVTANAAAGSTISNTATVSSSTPDANSGNNSATATTAVQAPQPGLGINDVALNEGNAGPTTFTFTVSLSAPAPGGGVTFDIATQDNTALAANNDYIARSLTSQTISAGQTAYTFDVTVNGDTIVEPNETFFVNVTNVVGATVTDGQGQGTIQNDDTATLVISQLYAGGGNAGAQYSNDFVEIFNRGTTTINFAVTPYSVQYAGATATFGSNKVDLTSGTILPGQYFLVQLSSGGANGVALPTPDATGSINMAAAAGKVALVAGTTSLTGSGCPLPGTVADFVGYGTTADCFEGSGRAPAPSNTTADPRKNGGCTDTNDNAADFLLTAPFPRNTGTPVNNCTPGTPPNLTINDVSVVEGNSGTTTATFTVSLSAPAPSTDVTFDIATQDNTATTANSDYVAKALTNQIIPAGQQIYTFTVNVNGDVAIEPNETFFVNVTNVSGATVADGQGLGTIQNDDLPALSINDVSLNEGNSGTTTFTFTVSLSAPAPTGGVTFDIATQDNTATVANSDYVARSLTGQTIAAGSSTYSFDVTINGDVNIEANETFFVNVTNVSGATLTDGQGLGTIQNDDSPSLTINDVALNEGNSGATTFTFTVTSSLPAPTGGITFDIATQDGTATATSGDYVTRALTSQTITAGNTTYTFDVTVNGDTVVEPNETFFVNLSNVSNATIADGQGQGTIQNDDAAVVVISQVYGGGGNSGALYTNDFIELFNRGNTTVDLAGWSVQENAVSDTDAWTVTPICATGPCLLAPGKYFLVQEGAGASGTQSLPTPDATGTINLSATTAKVAVVSSTTPLAGACPAGIGILDLVGYGSTSATANFCFEGTGPAPAPSNTTADLRKAGGCTDTNNNAADFFVAGPFPRNSSSPTNNCTAGTPPNLTIDDVSVAEGNSGTTTATFTVSLSVPAPSTDITFDIGTQDNTATVANSDYVAKSLTGQVIPAGQTTYSFSVTVNGDANIEPNETFLVNVTNVVGATVTDGQGAGTIHNDDVPALSINDVSFTEGNTGTKTFTFTVSLSAPAPSTITFDIATQDNTATVADTDYVAHSVTAQTISTGNSSVTFDVTVNGDSNIELDETFFVNVTNVSGATVSDGQGLGTILNDDSPQLTINDVTVPEPDSGTTTAQFTVTLSPTSTQTVMVNYITANNTAIAPTDYQTTSGTLTFTPGQSTQTIDVLVNGDTTNEAICETFFVNLNTPVNAAISDPQGIGSITDNDGTKLVISQIYGGGGNASATYTNDFIEIFNRGNTAVSLNGMSVQYAAATSTTGNYSVTALPNLLLQPGQYFLIQESSGGATGIPLPTPDATGTIVMAAGAGKVALVNSITALPAAGCPSGPTIIDFVGYGTTANCREGASTADNAPGPANNTTSTQRKQAGCQDVNNNQTDFATAAVNPRNTATAASQCSCSTSYSSMLKLNRDSWRVELAVLLFQRDAHLDQTRY
ncbi:MAG TPA: hypothetical protein DC047_15875 [Blastocatellia bacterium]|nr:hypothetical protein [Blastocatellia bacterium]